MSDALAAIDARLAALAEARAGLDYLDSFEEWGRRTRMIDAEAATLRSQRDALIRQRQLYNGCEDRLGRATLARGP